MRNPPVFLSKTKDYKHWLIFEPKFKDWMYFWLWLDLKG